MQHKKIRLLGILILLHSIFINVAEINAAEIIDLTHAFSEKTLHWPTAQPFKLTKGFWGHTDKGYYYAVNDYCSSEHVGTHMDAPVHFAEGHESVANVPLSQLVGAGIVIDVRAKTSKDRDYQIAVEDLQDWEKQHGRIPEHAIVLLETGFSEYWPDAKRYLGTSQQGQAAVAKLHFPGLSPEAAKWLAEERKIKSLGIDTVSIDYGQSKMFLTHQMLGEHDIPFFENIADLSKLPAKGFTVYALPMKIEHGTGAPVRVIAILG